MFSKLFGIFSIKRRFSSTEEVADTSVAEGSGRPNKRVRIEEPNSTLEEVTQQNIPVQDACILDEEEEEELEVLNEIIPRGMKGKEVERLGDLEEEVKETRAIAARLREETQNYIESIDRAMNCVVCLNFIRNPQVLSECGHTVCYPCLRSWFMRDTEDRNTAPMVSTDEESDGENAPKPGSSKATPPPRRRHRFHSAVNRIKVCPECSMVVTRRPLPLFRLRNLADTLNGSESPIPSIIQPRRKLHKVSKRKDLWHGIFAERGDDKKGQWRLDVENPEPMTEEGHNPVLEQAEAIPDANLEWLRWQSAMDEAREEGRRQMMRELRRDRELVHEERRRQPLNLFGEQVRDQAIGSLGRRVRGLPLPRDRTLPANAPIPIPASVASLPPSTFQPQLIPAQAPWLPLLPTRQQSIPLPLSRPASPTQHDEFWSGADGLTPPPSHPIFLIPPPSSAGPSNLNPSPTASLHTPVTSIEPCSSPMILESLQRLRRQYNQPSPQPTEGDVDLLGHEDDDEDLPLFAAMMQATNPPPNLDFQREYPVYAEDLNREEDLPPESQAVEVDLPVIIDLDEEDGRVGSFAYPEDRMPVQEVE